MRLARPGYGTVLRGAVLLLIILSLVRSVGVARDRGMDRGLQTLDFHFVAAAIAISQVYHDAPGRYLGYPAVYSTLAGVAASSQDATQIAEFKIADARAAFQAATTQAIPPGEKRSGPFFLQDTPNDIGYVDFIAFALSLLDRGVESLYLFYFLFFSGSVALFLVGHWKRLDALAWLALGVIASDLLIVQSDVFRDPRHQLHNVHDYRFVSSLAIIPALHLASLATSSTRVGFGMILPALGQGLLLALAIWFRSSALWAVLGVVLYWAIAWMPISRRIVATEEKFGNRLPLLLVGISVAAAAVLAVVVLDRRIDPDYADRSLTTTYLRWHAAYVGLAADEDTWHRRKSSRQVDGLDDQNGYVAAEDIIASQRLNKAALVRPSGGFAWKWYDETMRHLVLDYLLADPAAAVRLYFWHKPVRFLSFLVPEVMTILVGNLVGAVLAVLGILAAAACFTAAAPEPAARQALVASIAFVAASAGPPIFAYTLDHGMADQVFIGLWVALVAAAAVASVAARRLVHIVPS